MSKFSPLKLRQRGNSIVAMLSAFLLLFLFSTNLVAQSVPEAINYQAIVRDAESFLPISDQGAYVSVEFLDGPDGDVLYQEEFSSIQTGKAGLINLSLGQGDPMINSFESISWETGNVWLRLSVDIGNGLNILQETPFNTVPYAFYANSSGSSNADGDSDSTNEFQDLGNTVVTPNEEVEITLTDGANTTINIQDADANATNELQNIESTDGSISVTPSGNDFDLSVAAADGSETIVNDGQNTTVNGSGTFADPYAIDVPDNLDNDPVNEIQDISTDNTAGNIAISDGSALTINVDDADANPENELQNIQLSGDFLSLTNVSPAAQVDMRQFDQSDLSQGHIFIGDGSDEASEVQVFGDIELDSTGDSKVRGIQGVDVSGTAPDNGDVLVYSSTTSEWRPRSPSSVVNPSVTSYYSIDPLDFRELVDPLIGVDLDEGGSLKFYDDDAPFAMLINDAGIIEIMAPLHLPHGAEITNLKMYLRDNIGAGMRVSLYRKRMTDYSVGNDVLSAVLIGGPAGDKELNVNITNLNTVDNINYSYRIYVRFDTNGLENDNDASIDDIEQAVYGGVIEYTTN